MKEETKNRQSLATKLCMSVVLHRIFQNVSCAFTDDVVIMFQDGS